MRTYLPSRFFCTLYSGITSIENSGSLVLFSLKGIPCAKAVFFDFAFGRASINSEMAEMCAHAAWREGLVCLCQNLFLVFIVGKQSTAT